MRHVERALATQEIASGDLIRASRAPGVWRRVQRVASIMLLAACEPEAPLGAMPGADQSAQLETILSQDVVVVDEAAAQALVVADDTISFRLSAETEWLASVPLGSVLVSGAGDGFILRVRDVVVTKAAGIGAIVSIATELASLTDVFVQHHVRHCEPITLGPYATGSQDVVGGTTAEARAGYDVRFDSVPELCITWTIREGGVEVFESTLSGVADLSLQTNAGLMAVADFARRAVLWRAPAARMVIPMPAPLPPIPALIALRVEGRLDASADAAVSFTSGLRWTMSGRYGMRYATGEWSAIDERATELEPIAPVLTTHANAQITTSIAPVLDVRLLGVAGPTLALEPYLRMDVTSCPQQEPPYEWALVGGVDGQASATLDLFRLGSVGPFEFNAVGPLEFGSGPPGADCDAKDEDETRGTAPRAEATCVGCVELIVPVSGPNQQAEFLFRRTAPADFSDATVRWTIQLITPAADLPDDAHVTLFARNGAPGAPAAFASVAMTTATFAPSTFYDIELNTAELRPIDPCQVCPAECEECACGATCEACAAWCPLLPNGGFDKSLVSELGLQLGTGDASVNGGTIHIAVDAVYVNGAPGVPAVTFDTSLEGLTIDEPNAPEGTLIRIRPYDAM